MSRIVLTTAALGFLLCSNLHAQPAPYPPPPPGYPPPPPGTVYVAPGAAVPPGQPYIGPDGLTYVNGSPVYFVGGVYQPLVFVAGFGWGYYGFGHRFFPAPGPLRVRLDHFYPGGRGYPGHFEGRGFHDERRFDNRGFR